MLMNNVILLGRPQNFKILSPPYIPLVAALVILWCIDMCVLQDTKSIYNIKTSISLPNNYYFQVVKTAKDSGTGQSLSAKEWSI